MDKTCILCSYVLKNLRNLWLVRFKSRRCFIDRRNKLTLTWGTPTLHGPEYGVEAPADVGRRPWEVTPEAAPRVRVDCPGQRQRRHARLKRTITTINQFPQRLMLKWISGNSHSSDSLLFKVEIFKDTFWQLFCTLLWYDYAVNGSARSGLVGQIQNEIHFPKNISESLLALSSK